jgi:hypothetical protein
MTKNDDAINHVGLGTLDRGQIVSGRFHELDIRNGRQPLQKRAFLLGFLTTVK